MTTTESYDETLVGPHNTWSFAIIMVCLTCMCAFYHVEEEVLRGLKLIK